MIDKYVVPSAGDDVEMDIAKWTQVIVPYFIVQSGKCAVSSNAKPVPTAKPLPILPRGFPG